MESSATDSDESSEISVSQLLKERVRFNFGRMNQWTTFLSEKQRKAFGADVAGKLLRAIMVESYRDGYFRIRETVPLCLAAARRLNEMGDHRSGREWLHFSEEEFGHDQVALKDLACLFGSESAVEQDLRLRGPSLPVTAMIGYLERQVRVGNPHLLIVYKLFTEQNAVEQIHAADRLIQVLGPQATRCIAMHRGLDAEHVVECEKYIDSRFSLEDAVELMRVADFIGECFMKSQLSAADRVL